MADRIGSQTPRIQVEPERVRSDGEDAAILMAAYGSSLDPWQRGVVDCWLGCDASGAYSVTSAGLALSRQNGKNVCLETREFFGLVINGEKILHTAHQVRTAKKSFNRLARMFTDKRHPEIIVLVKNIRRTNGEEAIELVNGGLIEFSARSRQAARGFDGISLVVYDEAQELTDDQAEAIMATLAASATGTRQIIYTGTPPYPGCPGTVFRRRRTACLQAPSAHDAWHEWSVDGDDVEKISVDDRDLWYQTNPALGIHLTEDFTAEELRSWTRDGFARERLTRIVNTNFTEEDLSNTLTYRDNPGSKEDAVKLLQKYIRKLRAQYKKAGLELKYVWQMEKSKKGRYHVHMILSGGIDRDELEKLWGHGYANSRRLQFDKNGVAALVGYITKSHHSKDEERITYKAWNGSRNLIDPEPEISDTKVKSRKKAMELADGDFNAWNEIFPEYELADINQFHSDEYGSVYLFARLYRRDGKRMPPKRKAKE